MDRRAFGTLLVTGTLGGDARLPVSAQGATVTNASNMTTGTLADARLPVTAQAATLGATYMAPEAYVAAPTGVFATDTANILAAVDKLPTTGLAVGGIVVLREGIYSASLPVRPYVTYRGQGISRTRVNCPTGSMLTVSSIIPHLSFEHLSLSTSGSHLMDMGTTGYLASSVFDDCSLSSTVDAAGLVNGTGSATWQEVVMKNCWLTMTSTATVSAFDIRSNTGGLNCNVWEECRANGGNNANVPFWYLEASTLYAYNNAFKQITSEQNAAGIIKILSPNGLTLENVHDYDTTLYVASPIVIGKSAAGGAPTRIRLSNAGTVGNSESWANVSHVEFTYTPVDVILDRVGDQFGNRKVTYPAGYNATILDAGGASGRLRTVTASTALDDNIDGALIFNGSSLTATLPSPATVLVGRRFTVKNLHSTALTVVSAGTSVTLDGASSQSLAQWGKATYVTNGSTWFTV